MTIRIHPTAEVSDDATIGESTSIWHQAQVREGAQLGSRITFLFFTALRLKMVSSLAHMSVSRMT
jgi:carbonic anhydrase/acetyltransferase-like protein (isoleucine patch superfamily)